MTEEITVTDAHRALAKFIKAKHGAGVKPETVALVLKAQRDYRDDPERRAELEARKAAAVLKQEERVKAAKARYEAQLAKLERAKGPVELDPAPELDSDTPPWDDPEEVSPEPVETIPAPTKPKRKPKKAVERYANVDPDGFDDADESGEAEIVEEDAPAAKTVTLDEEPEDEDEDEWDFEPASADEEDF